MFVFIFILSNSWIVFNSKNSGRSKRKLCWLTWFLWRWGSHLRWQSTESGNWGNMPGKQVLREEWAQMGVFLCALYPVRSEPVMEWSDYSFHPPRLDMSQGEWMAEQLRAGAGREPWGKWRQRETVGKVWKSERWVGATFPFKASGELIWSVQNIAEKQWKWPFGKTGMRIWI